MKKDTNIVFFSNWFPPSCVLNSATGASAGINKNYSASEKMMMMMIFMMMMMMILLMVIWCFSWSFLWWWRFLWWWWFSWWWRWWRQWRLLLGSKRTTSLQWPISVSTAVGFFQWNSPKNRTGSLEMKAKFIFPLCFQRIY